MAADTEEARDTLREEPGCALILLGEMVSPANTCDTIKAIQTDAPSGQIPLVVIGRSIEAETQSCFIKAGATDLIAKPVTRARLKVVLTAMLGTVELQHLQETV